MVGRAVPDVSKNRSAFTFSVKRHIGIPVRTSKPAMSLSSCKYANPRITSGEGPMIIKRQVLIYTFKSSNDRRHLSEIANTCVLYGCVPRTVDPKLPLPRLSLSLSLTHTHTHTEQDLLSESPIPFSSPFTGANFCGKNV